MVCGSQGNVFELTQVQFVQSVKQEDRGPVKMEGNQRDFNDRLHF